MTEPKDVSSDNANTAVHAATTAKNPSSDVVPAPPSNKIPVPGAAASEHTDAGSVGAVSVDSGPLATTPPHTSSMASASGSGSIGSTPSQDEVRTLFLSGLPHDVKERELHLLFRTSPQFECASINYNGKQPVAFAVFQDQPSALAAKDELNGFQFDPDSPITLRIELAKSNSKARRPRNSGSSGGNGSPPSIGYAAAGYYGDAMLDKRSAYAPAASNGMYFAPPSDVSYWGAAASSLVGYGSGASQVDPYLMGGARAQATPPPCSTLFIANLGHSVSEEELNDVFMRTTGFRRMRMLHNQKDSGPVAFIEYTDVAYSGQAMHQLQGYKLRSSDRSGGIRIEFAKNRMGTAQQQQQQQQQQQGVPVQQGMPHHTGAPSFARRGMMPTSPPGALGPLDPSYLMPELLATDPNGMAAGGVPYPHHQVQAEY